ncbi:unnamed protein product [Merluccius merluccius]
MITRRRGAIKRNEVQSLEVEVTDAVETIDNLPCLHEDVDGTGLELDDLFGIDNLKWTLDNDTTSSLFDIGLTDFGLYNMKDDDSMFEHSTSPSPERNPYDAMSKKRENGSGSMINKNAIAARLNRLKKKEYVDNLEKKVGFLSTENHTLKQENSGLNKKVEELEDETRYLRAVLANESMLGQLLSRLSGVNGMKLSSSLFQAANSNDHDYALPRKRIKVEEKETSGGVCLHVDKNHVSVEFCTKCAENASATLKM